MRDEFIGVCFFGKAAAVFYMQTYRGEKANKFSPTRLGVVCLLLICLQSIIKTTSKKRAHKRLYWVCHVVKVYCTPYGTQAMGPSQELWWLLRIEFCVPNIFSRVFVCLSNFRRCKFAVKTKKFIAKDAPHNRQGRFYGIF